MLKKLAEYFALSFCSLCAFTPVFHAAAYAQTETAITPTPKPIPPKEIIPTHFFTVEASPTTKENSIHNENQTDNATLNTTSLQDTSLSPSPTPTSIPPTSTPTATPTPMQPEPTLQAPVVQNPTGGMDAEKLFAMSNAHRQAIGAPPLQKDAQTCSLATARATEIAGEMAAGILHSGMYGRNLPYWNTENAIALAPEEAAFNWWLNEPIHRQAIENPGHTISCVACSGNYCVQEFTSYQPK